MDKFGFTISKKRQISFNTNDRSIAEYIYTHEPSFRLCIECGGCSATCTAGNMTRISLREIQILIKRGENESAHTDLHKCMLCGKCILVCPRGVNTRNVIALARQAFRKRENYAI
jgi:heterodisulfide reductase subunit C